MSNTKPENKPKPKKGVKVEDLDLDPDAWPKFEKLIRDAAKDRPPPRSKGKPTK